MGNDHSVGCSGHKPRKNVHWKTAERPAPPGKPEIIPLYSEDEPNAIQLTWMIPVHDGGAPLAGFHVECNRIGSSIWIPTSPAVVIRPELILTGLDPGYKYQFRVAASNVIGYSDFSELSDILTITSDRSPYTPPKFHLELVDYNCMENEKSEFVVEFHGLPPPTIAWFKDGFEIFSSRRTTITTTDTSSILVIHQTLLTDEGEIKCTATNRSGYTVSKATLTVEAPPKLRFPRQYEDGLLYGVSETIFLKTTVVGKPAPEIEWRHDGTVLKSNERLEIVANAKFSSMRIPSASRSDRGEYQISAKNSIGEDFASFLVTVTAPPDPPTNINVSRLLDKSITVNWDAPADDGGCKVGNYIIEYFRVGWNVWLKATTSRKLSVALFDLIEGSQYRFRVKAENPYGISDPSEESSTIFVPGKSADLSLLETEFKIINEVLRKEDGIDLPPISPPRKRNKEQNDPMEISSKAPKMTESTDYIHNNHESTKKEQTYLRTSAENERSRSRGSNEIMLLLYPEDKKQTSPKPENRKSFQLELEDSLCPPPLSLSAPDLSQNVNLDFLPLRYCISSTELLHEKAMDRMYKAVALKEEMEQNFKKFSKNIENKTSHMVCEQPFQPPKTEMFVPSLLITTDFSDIDQRLEEVSNYVDGKESFNITDKLEAAASSPNTQPRSKPWQSISFDEDYTASTVSSGDEYGANELEDELDEPSDGEHFLEEKSEIEPKSCLPDPNFIPKPILKKNNIDKTGVNHSTISVAQKPKTSIFDKITKASNFPKINLKPKKKESLQAAKPEITPVSNTITTKEAPAKEKLNEPDENTVIVEHYGNIVKEFGMQKKKTAPLLLNTEQLKKAADVQEKHSSNVKIFEPSQRRESIKSTLSNTSKNEIMNNEGLNSRKNSLKEAVSQKTSRAASTCSDMREQSDKKTPRAVIVIPVDLEELDKQAKRNVRSAFDYTIDGCLLLLSFWLYLFKDERLAIPLLVLIVYRQLKEIQELVLNTAVSWLDKIRPHNKNT